MEVEDDVNGDDEDDDDDGGDGGGFSPLPFEFFSSSFLSSFSGSLSMWRLRILSNHLGSPLFK